MNAMTKCPHCKEPVDARLEHPWYPNEWLIRCDACDVWSVVPK